MKKLIFFLPLILYVSIAWGLVADYSFTQSNQTYTEITGGTVVASGNLDEEQYALALPFGLTFNFTPVTELAMSTNGYLSFNAGTTHFGYFSISSNTAGDGVAAVMSRDLMGRADGEMRYEVFGTAPNRYAIYQWKNWTAYGPAYVNDNWNFQIILYETSNNIAFHYGSFSYASSFASTAQIGLRGATNADFKNRATTTDWSATTAGTINTATCAISYLIYPVSGLQFMFAPAEPTQPPYPPTLVFPTNGAINQSTSITLNWVNGGGAPTGYKLYFGTDTPPTNLANGLDLGNVTSYAPTLMYATTYYWQIVPYNNYGDAVGCQIWTFTTMDECTITTFPYLERFNYIEESGCWTNVNTSGTGEWSYVTSGTDPSCAPYQGTGMAMFNSWSALPGSKAELASPSINFQDGEYLVKFWMYGDPGGYTTGDLVNVYYNPSMNTAADGILLGTVYRYKTVEGWYQHTFNLPENVHGNGRYIIFEGVSNFDNNIFVDDILITYLSHDVAPLSIDVADAFSTDPLYPKATVKNHGLWEETFNVRMDISDPGSNLSYDTQSVTLAAGASAQVDFFPGGGFIPTEDTFYQFTVTTLLSYDEKVANDVLQVRPKKCLWLEYQAYADAVDDPDQVLNGPCTFMLKSPGIVTDLAFAEPNPDSFMPGADWRYRGFLGWYGSDNLTGNFWNINSNSGYMSDSGNLPSGTQYPAVNIAFDHNHHQWYGASNNNLFIFEPQTSTSTVPVSMGLPLNSFMVSIAYDVQMNVLWGIELENDDLYYMQPGPSVVPAVWAGNLGVDLDGYQDLSMYNDTGELFLAGFANGVGSLYWIDTDHLYQNNLAYKIGDFQSGTQMAGFAIPWNGADIRPIEYITGFHIGNMIILQWLGYYDFPGITLYNIWASDTPTILGRDEWTLVATTTDTTWTAPMTSDRKFYYVTVSDSTDVRKTGVHYRDSEVIKRAQFINPNRKPRLENMPAEPRPFNNPANPGLYSPAIKP